MPKDASLPAPEHVMANDIDYVIELKGASFSWPEVQSHPADDQLQSNHNGNLVINNGTYKGMNVVFSSGKHEPTLFAQRLYTQKRKEWDQNGSSEVPFPCSQNRL